MLLHELSLCLLNIVVKQHGGNVGADIPRKVSQLVGQVAFHIDLVCSLSVSGNIAFQFCHVLKKEPSFHQISNISPKCLVKALPPSFSQASLPTSALTAFWNPPTNMSGEYSMSDVLVYCLWQHSNSN